MSARLTKEQLIEPDVLSFASAVVTAVVVGLVLRLLFRGFRGPRR